MPFIAAAPAYTLDTATSIFYVGALFVLCFFFVMAMIGINLLPKEDPRDENGEIISIQWLKFLRYPLGAIAWGMLVAISFVIYNFAEGYLTESLLVNLFLAIWRLLMISAMIGIPIIFWFMVTRFIQDKVIKRMLERNIMGGDKF